MEFAKAIELEKFKAKNYRAVVRSGKKQIALIGDENGNVFAVDNRCPHEGYPLIQGTLGEDCVLTCQWHNWKFDLKTGSCLVGADNVRSYPTKIEEDYILVGISDPSQEDIKNSILKGLKIAFEKRQYDRIVRELARLSFNKIDPICAVSKAIEWSHDKFEFGMTHAYAATADWLTLYFQHKDSREHQLAALTEAIDHISNDSLRHPSYPFSKETTNFTEDLFREAIEEENQNKACSLLLGAFEQGLHFSDLEKVFTDIALRHYNDFGHSLIYVQKSGELISFLGEEVEKFVLLSLTRSLCYTTREDLIPDFKDYGKCLGLMKKDHITENHPLDFKELLTLSPNQAMRWVVQKFETVSIPSLYDCLLRANAWNFLHYDTQNEFRVDCSPSEEKGWLSFTHTITFANAARTQCEKSPQFWKRALLQMACFVGRNNSYTLKKDEKNENHFSGDIQEFKNKSIEIIFDHGISAPIFSAHLLKTYMATMSEAKIANETTSDMLLNSCFRFLNSPLKGKHVKRKIYQGISLVSKDF